VTVTTIGGMRTSPRVTWGCRGPRSRHKKLHDTHSICPCQEVVDRCPASVFFKLWVEEKGIFPREGRGCKNSVRLMGPQAADQHLLKSKVVAGDPVVFLWFFWDLYKVGNSGKPAKKWEGTGEKVQAAENLKVPKGTQKRGAAGGTA